MVALLIIYLIYLALFGVISYAVLFHLTRYHLAGDRSGVVFWLYVILSIVIIVGSILFLQPA